MAPTLLRRRDMAPKPAIDPRITAAANHWGLDPSLVNAVVQAEGGIAHILTAVQCSTKSVQTIEEALEITCRSATHRMWEYVKTHCGVQYVEYFGSQWAPIGVENDPHNLNVNWVPNVKKFWLGS